MNATVNATATRPRTTALALAAAALTAASFIATDGTVKWLGERYVTLDRPVFGFITRPPPGPPTHSKVPAND